MRGSWFGLVLTMSLLPPTLGNAQVYQFRTPPPPVTAQYAVWQFNDEPIIVNNLIYYATRETRFFDGEIMAQVGVFRLVPVYPDVTLEPWSVIYVPVGRLMMRGYERRREGALAGTQGSRVPAFPVDIPSAAPPVERGLPDTVGTAGSVVPAPAREPAYAAPAPRGNEGPSVPRPARTRIESIPRPTATNGVWLEFRGARWYSDGPAAAFEPQRFTQIGEYRGFPVYRDNHGGPEEIWVRVVADGPVAPYTKR